MKIALVGGSDYAIWNYRRGLIDSLIQKGVEVHVICPNGKYADLLSNHGVKHIPITLSRFMSPPKDLSFMIQMFKICRREKFDMIHTFSIKPNIFATIAAKIAGIEKIVCSVNGRGYVFSSVTQKKIKLLMPVIKKLYSISCGLAERVWFQNQDDIDFFVSSKLISKDKAVLVRSSGINTDELNIKAIDPEKISKLRDSLEIEPSAKIVVMVSRMMWCKGVREFIEASEIVKEKHPSVKFYCLGNIEDGHPLSVTREFMQENESKNFQWLGFRKDVDDIVALSDIAVLPSYYTEGVPRVLLEAMAMSKPIVTTDYIGCKEAVDDNKNGYLVPIKDAKSLANAIETLLSDDQKRSEFGRHSRSKVEHEFDEKLVIRGIIKHLYQIN